MRTYLALTLTASLLTSPPVRAQTADIPELRPQTADMAEIKCGDLDRLYFDEFVVIDAWFSGYYHGKSGTTVIDSNTIAANTAKVLNFCKTNPDVTIVQAVEKLAKGG
jgi:acid stress chaperone HdeB